MQFEKGFVSRLIKREEAAFTELYSALAPGLYNYIRYRLGRDQAADDVLAEVFSDAVDYAGSLTLNHNVQAWLFRIAKSKIADFFRRRGRELTWRDGTPVDTIANGKGHGRDPAEQLLKTEEQQAVRAAFAQLSPEHREVLERMYVAEQSMKEIAEALGKSPKAIESLLYRARRELEKALAHLVKNPGRKGNTDV